MKSRSVVYLNLARLISAAVSPAGAAKGKFYVAADAGAATHTATIAFDYRF